LSSPKTEMVSGIFVNESGRMLVSLFVWIGKRVTILLPIFFYHKLAQSLLTMGFGLVVTPPGYTVSVLALCFAKKVIRLLLEKRQPFQALNTLPVQPGSHLFYPQINLTKKKVSLALT
jgi:hypothetical protein